jgi:small subunit ribosomal protein S6
MVSETVVTEVAEGLRDYELVLIVNPQLGDEAFDAAIDKYTRFITGKGGIIGDTQRWGKRKLAYPIKHFGEGNYVLFKSRMKPAVSRELEANLRISEEIMRHLLVRVDG